MSIKQTLKQLNNFDLLRLVFAFIVFIHHAYRLSLHPDLEIITYFFNINFALESFFVISGFLVFMSYENSSSLKEYGLKRVLRIYPAYGAVVVLSVVLGFFVTKSSLEGYLSLNLLTYLGANLCFLNFLQPALPGVFGDNPVTAVNGALWTIRTEVLCYCCVPLIVKAVKKYGRLPAFLLLYVMLFSVKAVSSSIAIGTENALLAAIPYIPWHFLFFLSGGIIYFYYEEYKNNAFLFLSAAIVLYLTYSLTSLTLFKPLSLAVVILFVAVSLPYAGNFSKFGDLSYGTYILHFPILQVMIVYGLFEFRPWESLLIAITVVGIGSWLCWHIIEKKFLLRSSHYIRAERKKYGKERGFTV